MAYDPLNKFYDPQSDYTRLIQYQISQGAPKEHIAELLQMRNNKIVATPGLEKYLYDDVYKQTMDYLSTGNVGPALQPQQRDITRDTPLTTSPYTSGGTVGTTAGAYDTTSQTNALLDAQLASKVAALKKQNEAALANLAKSLSQTTSSLDAAAEGTKTGFKAQRSAAAARSDIGALNFAQQMAARGIRGSAAGLPDIYRNIGLQNALSALGAQEASALSDIERERALAKSAYETDYANLQNNLAYDLAIAGADTEALKAQAQIAALQQAQQKAEQLAAQAKEDWSTYAPGAYYNDYQAEIDRIDKLIAAGQAVDSDGISLAYKKMVLTSARNEKLAQLAAQAAKAYKSSGSGGSGSKSGSSSSDNTNSVVQTMLSLGSDIKAYDYLLSLGLPQGTTQAAWEFYKSQKTNYPKFNPPTSPGNAPAMLLSTADATETIRKYIISGRSLDDAANYLADMVEKGYITAAQAKTVAKNVGINL